MIVFLRHFIPLCVLLLPSTSLARPPCQAPPNQVPFIDNTRYGERRNQVVVLTSEQYADLYELYTRCLVARSGTKEDWQQFIHRALEDARVRTELAADAPYLAHLEQIEYIATLLSNQHAGPNKRTDESELARRVELEAAILGLKEQLKLYEETPTAPATSEQTPAQQ
ncbi:MAG: hypothetical protein QG626_670 [Patescibacteria group bacterium]|nr:hypothetical protein [Patescibacteria group bacterium]